MTSPEENSKLSADWWNLLEPFVAAQPENGYEYNVPTLPGFFSGYSIIWIVEAYT